MDLVSPRQGAVEALESHSFFFPFHLHWYWGKGLQDWGWGHGEASGPQGDGLFRGIGFKKPEMVLFLFLREKIMAPP